MSFSTAWLKSNYVLAKGGWVLVQNADNSASSTLAFGSGNTLGNLLIMGIVMNSTTTASPTDSAGNSWVFINKAVYNSSGNSVQLFYVASAKSGANTVTVTGAASIHLFEFSGQARYGLDTSSITSANPTGGSAGENALTGVALTTAFPGELVVGQVGRISGPLGVGTNNATWQSPGGDVSGLLEYFCSIPAGSVTADAFDSTASDPYAIVAAAFNVPSSLLSGLQVYYALDNTSDASGSGLTLTNNGVTTFSAGKVGNAANFVSASTQYLNRADNSKFQFGTSNDFTIACWIKFSGAPSNFAPNMAYGPFGGVNWGIYWQTGGGIVFEVSDGTNTVTPGNNRTFNDGAWHLMVATASRAGNATLYADNSVEGTPAGIAAIGNLNSATGLGIGGTGNGALLDDGAVDEVAIWNRVLTSQEISNLWNGGAGTTYPFSGL